MKTNRSSETGHLLVVDDNKVNRLLLGRGLESEGHGVGFAENGLQALTMLRAQSFDLVLLDVLMPEMDGYQVLEQIVGDPALRHIPVIMTSSVDEVDSVVRCIELGAEDYLTKPVNPVLLRARIGACLEKKRLRDQQRAVIRKLATAEVAQELETSGFSLGGKLVEVTVLFSDIRSFTALAESQSPADTIELLNTYYALMFEAIDGHSGNVNQIIGDGVMAVFGAPVPHPDRCEQAVRAALEMQELIALFNQEQAAQGKVQIRIGVGIASGQVVAGYAGTEHRAIYTCIGDTVNLASRLEAHTKVVGRPILIDEATQQGLKGILPTEALGPAEIKGKAQAVQVYAVPLAAPG